MDFINEKAKKIIKNMVITTLPKISVIGGKCRFNYKCHVNAVHDAINENHDKIAMCF